MTWSINGPVVPGGGGLVPVNQLNSEHPKSAKYPIASVTNAMHLLELYARARELRLSDVADSLDVSPSTAHRLLSTLESTGFVRQNPVTRCYEPGGGLIAVANALSTNGSRWSSAEPFLRGLSDRVGETVNLVVRSGADVSFMVSMEATSSVRVGSRLGAVMPAHRTSCGKVLLAGLSRVELVELYPDEQIPRSTSSGAASRTELWAELQRTAKRGYATNFGESEKGISGVAVRLTPEGLPPCAIAVSVPSNRIPADRIRALVAEMRTTADALTADLRS